MRKYFISLLVLTLSAVTANAQFATTSSATTTTTTQTQQLVQPQVIEQPLLIQHQLLAPTPMLSYNAYGAGGCGLGGNFGTRFGARGLGYGAGVPLGLGTGFNFNSRHFNFNTGGVPFNSGLNGFDIRARQGGVRGLLFGNEFRARGF